MSKRLTSGLVAAIAAVAMSIPAVGLADQGGVPNHHSKACKAHKHHGWHKGTLGQRKGMSKGKKCGFPSNSQAGTTGPTGGTGPTGTTGASGVNNHSHGHQGS
jgi:hypothetical protein